MERFQCVSHLENGLDIKTAGEFVREAIRCTSKITIRNGGRKGDAKLIFNVMSLGIRKGDVRPYDVYGNKPLIQQDLRRSLCGMHSDLFLGL